MRGTDVFQGVGDGARLRSLLMPGPVEQPACVGERLVAAVEELGADVSGFRARLEAVEARVERRLRSVELETAQECDYLVYLATPDGYRLTEKRGELPAGGDLIDDAGAAVLRVGPSPFPGDSRPCVFAVAHWTGADPTV